MEVNPDPSCASQTAHPQPPKPVTPFPAAPFPVLPAPSRPSRIASIYKPASICVSFLPKGYNISIAYEGLDRLRFLRESPDHRLFVTDLFDISDNKEGKIYVLDDWDSAAKQFKTLHTYLDSLHNPNQVAFYRDKGVDYLYLAETGTLTRYPYHKGDTIPSGRPQTIATFPDYGLDYKYGGWHLTRSLAFHRNKLYVSVGK